MIRDRPIAVVTCREFPALYGSEQALLPALAARGLRAEPVVWNDPAVNWAQYGLILVRSIWDYFRHYAAFRAWLDRIEALGVPVQNPVSLLRWNADKHYLLEFERAGVPIVPTALLEGGSGGTLGALLAERGWTRAVVKPAVSGNAEHTHTVTLETAGAHEVAVSALRQQGAVLVQPFAPEVQEEGEWSLLFFGGRFSHAVIKRPVRGDFRVQFTYGGTTERVQPSAAMQAQAARVIAALPAAPLYARIDGIRRGAEFLLMEAEVIEPYLYLDAAPEQLPALVTAVAEA